MTIGSIKSGIFPTEEMAESSLDGAITEIAKNQQVDVVGISTVEVDGGFMAVATLDIYELEEEEEPVSERKTEKQERSSAEPEAFAEYYISDLSRGNLPDKAFPKEDEDAGKSPADEIHAETPEEIIEREGDTGKGDSETSSNIDELRSSFEESGEGENRDNEVSSGYENATLPDEDRQEAAHLSEELKEDFDQAQNEEGVPDSVAFINTDAQNQLLEERETQEMIKKRRRLQEEILAAEQPVPELTE